MKTPICDFVQKYAEKKGVRAHMPGHKGVGDNLENLDITEIEGADVLFFSNGIIKESEDNAAKLFSTAKTLYSCEGSSLSIRAMVYMIAKYSQSNGSKAKILAARNVHKVFTSVTALLDIDVDYLFPESESFLECRITPQALENALSSYEEVPTAVYITSPDYLGNVADIKSLSEVCRKYGTLLAVDNAHGAYLRFLEEDIHPITLGADLCCDSAHKTLFSLTGGGYLHISENAPDFFKVGAENAMSVFASTSPSYLIMQSLDRQNPYLEKEFRGDLSRTVRKVENLKKALENHGFVLKGDEKLKITIDAKRYGYSGDALSEILRKSDIECEFSDPDFLTMMFSVKNGDEDFERIGKALTEIPERRCKFRERPRNTKPEMAMSPHDALFAKSERIKSSDGEGRILASISVTCPPAIPIVSLGERISKDAVYALMYYGIDEIDVVVD